MIAAEVDQFLFGHRGVGLDRDDRLDRFAPFGVGDPDHRHLADRLVPHQHLLDFPRINVFSPTDDHVVRAVHQEEVTGFIKISHVTGVKPASSERTGRGVRIAPVALHHQVAAGDNLSGLTGSQSPVFLVDNLDFDIGPGDARGAESLVLGGCAIEHVVVMRQVGDRHRALALSVQLDQAGPQSTDRSLEVLDQHRGTSINDRHQRLQVIPIDVGVFDQPPEHGGCDKDVGDPVLLDALEDLNRIEAGPGRDHMSGGAGDVGECVESAAVRERCGVQGHRVAAAVGVHVDEEAHRHRHQVAMGQHRSLGPAGGAGGVKQPGHVVGIDVGVFTLIRLVFEQRLVVDHFALCARGRDHVLDLGHRVGNLLQRLVEFRRGDHDT